MPNWTPVVDVSQHQGTIDFVKMRSEGVRHIILRATHGTTPDSRVAGYYAAAIAADYAPHEIGFYSFINPKRGGATTTAIATANLIKSITGRTDVLYMLDVESYRNESPNVGTVTLTGASFAAYLAAHRDVFHAHMPGSYVIAYSNRAFWNSTDGPRDSVLAAELEWLVPRYPIYSLAGYQAVGFPPAPPQWDEWAFSRVSGPYAPLGALRWHGWQFSAGYNRQGPRYGCQYPDLDLNIVDAEVAARWFAPPTPPPPPQEPTMANIIPETGTLFEAQCTTGQTYKVNLGWGRICIVGFECQDPSAPGYIAHANNPTESIVNYGADVAAYSAVVGQTWFGACPPEAGGADGIIPFFVGGVPGHTVRVKVKLQGRGA